MRHSYRANAVRHGAGLLRGIRILLAALLLWACMPLLRAPRAAAFDLDDVAATARQLAGQPYKDTRAQVPAWLLTITYDQWRDIRFRADHALWRDRHLPFEVQFFHPGLYYPRTIAVNEVTGDTVRPVVSSSDQFDYGKNDFASAIPRDLGYAGFRVHAPIKAAGYYDEVIVFLGASYFRAVGRDQGFGISARGIAINAIASSPEEFPDFAEYWLVTPAADATQLTIYALLNGPSITGAYRFVIQPGAQTLVDVDARIFLRRPVERLGIAPLTSMFFHGENTVHPFVDFRPEVHDSDGLLLHSKTGEWLWRPLENPRGVEVNAFQMQDPRGFGLMQRDRDFDHHQDLEAHTELRPSVWVAPRGDWGKGHVDLVQLPTNTDINDNIVAYWVPDTAPKPGEVATFAYTLSWYGDDPTRPPGGRVIATRRDWGTQDNRQRVVIDFAGDTLAALPADHPPRATVTVAGGSDVAELIDQQIVKNPATGGWRLSFQIRPKKNQPIELRAFLANDGGVLTETWSYATTW
jgi:periplasmic glucans biosynthesis protein